MAQLRVGFQEAPLGVVVLFADGRQLEVRRQDKALRALRRVGPSALDGAVFFAPVALATQVVPELVCGQAVQILFLRLRLGFGFGLVFFFDGLFGLALFCGFLCFAL